MKKVILFLFILIPFIVHAEDISLDFQSDQIYSVEHQNLFYRDGYVFMDSNNGYNPQSNTKETLISYYNKKGECLKTKYIEHYYLYSMFSNEQELYGYGRKDGSNEIFLFKFDEEFNVIKEYALNLDNLDQLNGGDILYDSFIANNKVEFVINNQSEHQYYVIQLDKNLSNKTVTTIEEYDEPEKFYIRTSEGKIIYRINLVEFKGNYYYVESRFKDDCVIGENETCAPFAVLVKLDKNYNIVWEKEYKEYQQFSSLVANSNYMFTIESKYDNAGSLLILDADGNVLDSLERNTAVENVIAKDDALVVNSGGVCTIISSFTAHDNGCQAQIRHKVYRIVYDIKTKIKEGKGRVEVVPNSHEGEGVTFKVIPEEGYVLGEVKVTDTNGNVVTFHEYTFTMPSADVTIEASFVKTVEKENPETKDIAISLLFIVFILSTGIIIYNKKRLKEIE